MSWQAPRLHINPAFALVAALLLVLAALFSALPAKAQSFPQLTGRVVDQANILPDDVEARLAQKLEGLEKQSQRQLVVVTLADLQGYEISDYGYQLGRHWGLGDKERNDGAMLIVAPKERKVRIEVGYGLEPLLTDGLSSLIIQQKIVPLFKAGDMPGGIEAGTDALITQLTLPADEAQKIAASAKPRPASRNGSIFPVVIFFGAILLFFILPLILRKRSKGRSKHYDGDMLGNVIMWSVLDGLARGGSGGGGSFGGDGGGFGGFSGGGGSFGGGGASGDW